MFESFDRKKKKSIPLDIGTDADPTIFLNDYSTMSNAHFKDILLTALTTEIERNTFIEFCHDNEHILTFTRQLTVFLSKLNYYKLQHEQWTYYYHFGTTEGIWHGRPSKKVAEVNSVCYSYGRSKALIQQRQQKYRQHYEQIQNELETYVKQLSNYSVDKKQLMTIVDHYVQNDQYRLRIEMKRRREMLKFDAHDHQLLEKFYKLKPQQTQVVHIDSIFDYFFPFTCIQVFRSILPQLFGEQPTMNKQFDVKFNYFSDGYLLQLPPFHITIPI